MTEVAARKRELIAEADLHRQTIVEESANLAAQAQSARDVIVRNRWLLGGAAAVAGVVVARRPGVLLNLVPMVVAAWRRFRGAAAEEQSES